MNQDELNQMIANGQLKDMTLEITVIRADGTVEEHGVVSRLEKPAKGLKARAKRFIRALKPKQE